jgi:hypothetical protein
VRRQEGVQITSSVDSPLPVLRIAAPAKPFIELPDLKDSWAWAHGQAAAGNSSDPNAVDKALNGAPQLSLSRLVCPRLLTANTDYIACVVSGFDLVARLASANRSPTWSHGGHRTRAGVDADGDDAAEMSCPVLHVVVPHRSDRRFRVARAALKISVRTDWVNEPSTCVNQVSLPATFPRKRP